MSKGTKTKEILSRMVALTIYKVTGILAGGAVVSEFSNTSIPTYVSAAMAAVVAILQVSNDLSEAFLVDGKLDDKEINSAFAGQASAAEEPVAKPPAVAQDDDDDDEVMCAPEAHPELHEGIK